MKAHLATFSLRWLPQSWRERLTTMMDDQSNPPSQNETLFQAFEWYLAENDTKDRATNSSHWSKLTDLLSDLQYLGITSLWLPPACKGQSSRDVGYGIYDLYDLGEFHTKGTTATRWGTKQELQILCQKASKREMGIIFDAVLNHRAAADGTEICEAVKVDNEDRRIELGKPQLIEAYTRFGYGARQGRYSSMQYNKQHFSGTDYDRRTRTNGIFKLIGPQKPGWASDVDDEKGNYDYLMFADVDYGNEEVQKDVLNWGKWLRDQLPGLSGIRLDAMKHYSSNFQNRFIQSVNRSGQKEIFWVGEYWRGDSEFLSTHINKFTDKLHLFDAKLVYNFHDASYGRIKDLRQLMQGSLVQIRPNHAVTFVANHDTQEGQSLAAPIQPWFIAHAYAFILLRSAGLPCVFWGDLYGNVGPNARLPACKGQLGRLVMARKLYAYGKQVDHFDEQTCVAWQRSGHPAHSDGTGLLAIVSISSISKIKHIYLGHQHAGEVWIDLMGWVTGEITITEKGYADFLVHPRSIGIWVRKGSPGEAIVSKFVYPMR